MAQVSWERGARDFPAKMMEGRSHASSGMGSCPRCDACGAVVRVRGIERDNVICRKCLSGALPFINIEAEGDFRGALRDFREGLGARASDFQGLRFDPFGDEERETLEKLDGALKGCKYTSGDELLGRLKTMAKEGGCSLSMLFHNIRSARGPGLELLEAEIRRWGIKWDLVGLAETWLDNESEKMTTVQGFNSVFASRKNKAGGGVALLIREGLVYRERSDLNVFLEGDVESLFIEIVREGGKKNVVVGVVYRPPSGNITLFNDEMAQVLSKIGTTEAYIMGDYNVDLLKSGTQRQTSDFLEGFYTGGFYPLVSLPTRLTDRTATLIDNFMTNNLEKELTSGLVTIRVSDHLPIYSFVGGDRKLSGGEVNGGMHRLVNEGRINRFVEDIRSWTFDEVRALGIEANVGRFRNQFRDLYDSAFPWVKNKRKRKDEEKPWLNDHEFKTIVTEKSELYTKKIKFGLNQGEEEKLVVLCREVNKARRRLKRTYFRDKLESINGNLRATWQTLGEALRGRKSTKGGEPCKYFEKDGKGVTIGSEIANGFCDFYCKVGPELAAKIWLDDSAGYLNYMGTRVNEELIWRPATAREVEDLCQGLDSSKGMGWDGVSPRIIKAVARELSGSLSRLYNCCMREGFYPSDFKVARVVPVFKAEDPTQFSNYRPVSVLPVLSQVFERLLKVRLVEFLDRQKVVVPNQYGFRAGHSTDMAILDMVEKIRTAWASKKVALGVFIDLKKAFDTVDHQILLHKLEHYGVRGQSLALLESYLKDRSQYVCYGGHDSERGSVECGVPQGSVLGPLFFILYVNDMVKASGDIDLVLFADDTNIFAEGRDHVELFRKVNRGLEELSRWFRCNKLTLNLKKTEYVYFGGIGGRVVPAGGLSIGEDSIRRVDGARFLGVWVDEGLKWSGQIERVKTKVGRLLGVLGRAKASLGGDSVHRLYNALVLPHLQYCLLVWGDFEEGRNKVLGDSLLKYQKRFMGLIAGKKGKYHSDPIFSQLGLLKVGDLYRQQLRVYAWKSIRGKLPENQVSMLSKVSDVHKHNTRNSKTGLSIASQDHRSIAYRVPKEWLGLPEKLRGLGSLGGFKRKSKDEFFQNYKAFKCNARNCLVCCHNVEHR